MLWGFPSCEEDVAALWIEESDWSDVFHVVMGQGAFCDCEILYNAAPESLLKSQYWQRRAHEMRS